MGWHIFTAEVIHSRPQMGSSSLGVAATRTPRAQSIHVWRPVKRGGVTVARRQEEDEEEDSAGSSAAASHLLLCVSLSTRSGTDATRTEDGGVRHGRRGFG